MYLYIRPSIYLSITIDLSIYISTIYLLYYVYQLTYLSRYLLFCLSIHKSIYLCICHYLYIFYLSLFLSIYFLSITVATLRHEYRFFLLRIWEKTKHESFFAIQGGTHAPPPFLHPSLSLLWRGKFPQLFSQKKFCSSGRI